MLKFTLRGTNLIVAVKGDIDQHNASKVREQVDLKISHENVKRLIFDFTELDFMDSSGIGIIIGRYKLMKAINGSVAIVANKPTIKKLLHLSGIKRIVTICDSLSEAFQSV